MERIQIVVDTNVLVAAFRSKRGAARLMLDKLNDTRWEVNLSTAMLLEYEDVLKRPEMHEHIALEDVDPFLQGMSAIARFHEIFYLWRTSINDDPNDAFVLELAVRSGSDFIVTFNRKHFTAAADFGIKLVTPKEFLQTLGDLR